MGEVVNLRTAKKQAARKAAARPAMRRRQSTARRTKAERALERARAEKAARDLEGLGRTAARARQPLVNPVRQGCRRR